MRTLVLGGVRSGKTGYGDSLLAGHDDVRRLVPGLITSADGEWVARVAGRTDPHDARYRSVTAAALTGALREDPAVPTLVDDLGHWLAGTLDQTGAWSDTTIDLSGPRSELCSAIADFTGDLVLVSPEAGLAVVPATPAGRRYQEELGALNSALAAVVDRAVLVIAGRTLELTAAPPPTAPAAAVVPPAVPAPVAAAPIGTGHQLGAGAAPDPVDAEVFAPVEPPAATAAGAARDRLNAAGYRPGSLGRIGGLAEFFAGVQGGGPTPLRAPAVVIFAGDHRIPDVAAIAPSRDQPTDDAATGGARILAGTAPVAVAAAQCGAELHLLDIAAERDVPGAVTIYRVRRGSGGAHLGGAASTAETRQGLAAGRAVADDLVDAGADLLIIGDLGVDNAIPAAALVATLTGKEPVEVAPKADGTDDARWCRETAAIRDAMRHGRARRHHALDLLAAVAGADLAAMAGFLAQAALRRTPVILDGLVTVAAALVAEELAPGARQWWLAGHRSAEPAQRMALERLSLTAAADLDLTAGGGTGAVLALPLVTTAIESFAAITAPA